MSTPMQTVIAKDRRTGLSMLRLGYSTPEYTVLYKDEQRNFFRMLTDLRIDALSSIMLRESHEQDIRVSTADHKQDYYNQGILELNGALDDIATNCKNGDWGWL